MNIKEKINNLTYQQKVLLMAYLLVIGITLIYLIIDISDPNSYTTTINCNGEVYIINSTINDSVLEDVCPQLLYAPSNDGFVLPPLESHIIK